MRDYIALIIVTLILFTMMSFQVQFFSTFENVAVRAQAGSLTSTVEIEIWEAVMKTLTSTNFLNATDDFISYRVEITNVQSSLPLNISMSGSALVITILGSQNEVSTLALPTSSWGRTVTYSQVSFGNVNHLTVRATLTSSTTVNIELEV